MASPSKKVASGIGISCIWQLHSPWGMLPGLGQELPEKFLLVGSVDTSTCEIVHPTAEPTPPCAAGWMKAAGGVVANPAAWNAPPEFPGRSGCHRKSPFLMVSSFVQQKTWSAILRIPCAVAGGTEGGLNGRTLARAADALTTGNIGEGGVSGAATDLD